jgi:hypothetical protein
MTLYLSEMLMRNNVTRLLILSACAILFAMMPAAAAPLPSCPDPALLSTYISLYGGTSGCQIGNLVFSEFAYNGPSGNGIAPTSSQITVDTVGPAGTGASEVSPQFPNNIGLSFNGTWFASAGEIADGDISFDVSIVGGGPATIEDAGLAQDSGITGNGIANVAENGCSGAVYPCTQQWAVETLESNTMDQTVNGTIFTQTGTISVGKDVQVIGQNGTATLSLVQDTFSQVPEPRSISLMLGFGLMAGLALRKKFQSVRG